MVNVVEVNPQILVWARERAGLSRRDAARKISQKEERLEKLERGDVAPSLSLLKRVAKAYRRPLLTFYMASPPKSAPPVGDFRPVTVLPPDEERALLEALVRDIRVRQSIVRDLLEGEDDVKDLEFVGKFIEVEKFKNGERIKAIVDDIRKTLNITHEDQKEAGSPDKLFKLLRARAEEAGVFILLAGDLGSPQHNSISVESFRGYALVDKIAPFIVINDKDAKAARSFTLMHELAHIWIGADGISGPTEMVPAEFIPSIEVLCNSVASEFLLPNSDLPEKEQNRAANVDYVDRVVQNIAQRWNISRPAVVYRLYKERLIEKHIWSDLNARYTEEWKRSREQEKERRAKLEGGPDYYVVKRDRLGNALLDLARQTISEGALSYTQAAKLLAVKASGIGPLLKKYR